MVFKVPARILAVYEHCPHYQGTRLWRVLDTEAQKKDTVFSLKKDIERIFKNYVAT